VNAASTAGKTSSLKSLIQPLFESESSDEEKEAETPTKKARGVSIQEKKETPSKMKKTSFKSPASLHGQGKGSAARMSGR